MNANGLLQPTLVQELETISASHVSYTLVTDYHILAFAQEVAETSALYVLSVHLPPERLFADAGASFQLIQQVPTRGARTMRPFAFRSGSGSDVFFAVAQSQDAQECALENTTSLHPVCHSAAVDMNLSQAQSVMMRWNGTLLQGNNVMDACAHRD